MNDVALTNDQVIAAALAGTDGMAPREKIDVLEKAMLGLPQVADMHLDHYVADGLYGRCLHIPKGTLLTGKIHKRSHINVVLKGVIVVATEQGEEIVEAPAVLVSPPGTKRVGLAIEDTVWLTIDAADGSDAVVNNREEYEGVL